MSTPERLLAPVTGTTYAQAGIAAAQRWSADYNVACWVRGRTSVPSRLVLLLRYRDAGGVREARVDQAESRQDAAMLLAGRCTIQAAGRIEEMTVWLQGDAKGEIIVDELYVQRVGAEAAKPLLAAR